MMVEVTKSVATLTERVDRLIADVGEHGKKLEKLGSDSAYVKGALAALTAVALVAGYFAHGQFDAILAALSKLSSGK